MKATGWTLIGRDGKRVVVKEQSWLNRNAHYLGLIAYLAVMTVIALWMGAFEAVG